MINQHLQFHRQPSILTSLLEQLEDGVIMEIYNTLLPLEDIKELASEVKPEKKILTITEKKYVIAEFLLRNKKTILKDKFLLCLSNSPDQQLLKTLDQESTLKGKDFYPFWNEQRKDLYNLLPFPVEIDSVGLDSIISSGFSTNIMSNSWFSMTKSYTKTKSLQETFLQSSKFLLANGMENEDTSEKNVKSKKMKLKVPKKAQLILHKFANLYRQVYNRCVWFHKETGMTGYALRDCVKSDYNYAVWQHLKELPTELRESASKEFTKNVQSMFTNHKNGNITHFNIQYQTKKAMKKKKSWTLPYFQARSIKHITKMKDETDDHFFMLLPSYIPMMFKTYEKLPKVINHEFSIHYDGKDFYLILVVDNDKNNDNKKQTGNVLAMDPGVRTFQTTYNCKGEIQEICKGESVSKLFSMAINIDRMITFRNKKKNRTETKREYQKKRKKMTFRIKQTRKRMKNLQDEMHKKTCDMLTKENDIIILPNFKVKEMSKKGQRRIRTKTVRRMQILAHAMFRERLKTKALERGCNLIIGSEHYTSKTCGKCGWIHWKLGGSKVFQCKMCHVTIDRDINAARNIMLRAMRGSAISFKEILDSLLFKNLFISDKMSNIVK